LEVLERQLFSLMLNSMRPWLLALFVLVVVCAIGAYYVHNTESYIYDVEGFDASGNLASFLKNQAQAKCEKDYSFCMEAGKANNTTCTTRYNACNVAALALDTNISTVPNSPGSTNSLSSATGALAYAKGLGMTGTGDAVEWAKSGKLLNLQYGGTKPFDTDPTTTEDAPDVEDERRMNNIYDDTTPLDPKMLELKKKIEKGYKPDSIDYKSAQGLGIITESENDVISLYSRLSDYNSRPQKIKPHETPKEEVKLITAKVKSDQGTNADLGADTGMESLRSQIRRDIKEAIREELAEINNEYEIVYE
jgi:hypothetical protein